MRQLVVALLLVITASIEAATAGEFQIVAHPSVKASSISREAASAIFLRKALRWGDRTEIVPVDQTYVAPVRQAFVSQVLGLSRGELQQYWNHELMSRRLLPPTIKSTDQEVLAFVAANPGAIGYVAPDVTITPGVKLLAFDN